MVQVTMPTQEWSKGKYQSLYMRVKRAKNNEERAVAEAALRNAFPNKRPRVSTSVKAATPAQAHTELAKKRSRKKLPKPLRSTKALKRGFNGKKSRSAKRAKKKKGRR